MRVTRCDRGPSGEGDRLGEAQGQVGLFDMGDGNP